MVVSVHGLQMGYNYLLVAPWNGMETGITGLLVLKAATWLLRWQLGSLDGSLAL